MQDTFVRLLEHPPRYTNDRALKRWLVVVMQRLQVDLVRRQERTARGPHASEWRPRTDRRKAR